VALSLGEEASQVFASICANEDTDLGFTIVLPIFSLKSGHPLVVLTVRQKSSFYHFKTVVRPPEVALQPTFWLGRESRHARCASLFSRIKPCKVVLLKDPLFF
jgi:hypothetical protein